MKKTKSLITSVVFALVFACVASCEEGEDKMNQKADTEISSQEPAASSRIASGVGSTVDSKVGDPISLATARQWASNYRENQPNETLGHLFGSEIIQQILGQTGCIGIRIYYATNDDGEKQLLLVGVDADGEDMLPAEGAKMEGDGYIVADASFPCPSTCPTIGL